MKLKKKISSKNKVHKNNRPHKDFNQEKKAHWPFFLLYLCLIYFTMQWKYLLNEDDYFCARCVLTFFFFTFMLQALRSKKTKYFYVNSFGFKSIYFTLKVYDFMLKICPWKRFFLD